MSSSIPVQLSFKGKVISLPDNAVTTETTPSDLYRLAEEALSIDSSTMTLKLLFKGKRLNNSNDNNDNEQVAVESPVFSSVPKKTPKIMVLATPVSNVAALNAKKQDKTIRSFDQERPSPSQQQQQLKKSIGNQVWGPSTSQDAQYKFCRFEACTWQSFGHRPSESTPHAFAAMQLLEQMATDPGVVAIMKERELVVGTLGEMDPIDDRLMQKTQENSGGCLLGYNTNGGLRIDVKLRTDDLSGFRPYPELVSTLIHELSHNWVGEHNLLFWTNFGQMRAEYLWTHIASFNVVRGKTTAQIAGLTNHDNKRPLKTMRHVYDYVMAELARDMAQHGLHPNMIASPIQDRCRELQASTEQGGRRLMEGNRVVSSSGTGTQQSQRSQNPRELALAAAQRRARKAQQERDAATKR